MSNDALITFKAGRCHLTGKTVTAQPDPGYIYVYKEDDLPHFCWRTRDRPGTDPVIDLTMVPGDGSFEPLLKEQGAEELHSPTNGRIYQLRFESSSQKYFFYLQSRSQHPNGDPSWWSERDQRLGQIVSSILQDEDVDVQGEMAEFRNQSGGSGGAPPQQDDEMDVDEPDPSTGGAGADATGGDPRQEGELSREGGADGGRAESGDTHTGDTSALVQNFLRSINQPGAQQSQQIEQPFTTLADLLTPADTIPFLDQATPQQIDALCRDLPIELFEDDTSSTAASQADSISHTEHDIAHISIGRKKAVITKVLRSPQLQQSLGSLTVALRDGGLPMIGDSLSVQVANGGFMRGTSVPLGGSNAVKAFVEGVRATVNQTQASKHEDGR